MTTAEIVKTVLDAETVAEVFPDLRNWHTTYKEMARALHPDVSGLSIPTDDIMKKLNLFKEEMENGKKFTDDSGLVTHKTNSIEFSGDDSLLSTSAKNYERVFNNASDNFKKYLPTSVSIQSGDMEDSAGNVIESNRYVFEIEKRAIPLSSLGKLSQEHVNWMLSRMLEFCGYLAQQKLVHASINPDSIFVVPETHGIVCASFYHLTEVNGKLRTVSGKWAHLYSAGVFSKKVASPNLDTDLSKKTAIILLGDETGEGTSIVDDSSTATKTRKFVQFCQKSHKDPIDCFKEYREFLQQNFDTKQFLPFKK